MASWICQVDALTKVTIRLVLVPARSASAAAGVPGVFGQRSLNLATTAVIFWPHKFSGASSAVIHSRSALTGRQRSVARWS